MASNGYKTRFIREFEIFIGGKKIQKKMRIFADVIFMK